MDQPAERSLTTGLQVGLPLLGALLLTAILRGLFPIQDLETWVLDPAVVAGLVLAGQLGYISHSLIPARSHGGPIDGLFGLANTVTLFRGVLYAVVAGFVVVPPDTPLVWVPAVAYGGGIVLDKLDGTIARTIGQETNLGERLDMMFDTVGFVAAPLVAVLWGWLPIWYLSLSAARYVYRGGLVWRRRRGRPLFDLPESGLRRYFAGLQMVFLTIALTPAVPREFVWTAAPFVLAPSLGMFGRDFLAVTGRLPRQEQ